MTNPDWNARIDEAVDAMKRASGGYFVTVDRSVDRISDNALRELACIAINTYLTRKYIEENVDDA